MGGGEKKKASLKFPVTAECGCQGQRFLALLIYILTHALNGKVPHAKRQGRSWLQRKAPALLPGFWFLKAFLNVIFEVMIEARRAKVKPSK